MENRPLSTPSSQPRERLERLRSKLALVPQSPGVYIHKSDDGKILYVGKARNLQGRLRSYFTGLERHTPKTRALVSRIEDFEVIKVDNENESLLLENNLIKHNKPPYNILLRDDKTYPYLKMDLNEPWPKLMQTRRRKNDGALYFGPYASGGDLHKVMSVVQRFFPLVKCTQAVFKTVTRPCNYYDIRRCLGPCHLPVDRAEYMEHVNRVVDVLRGKSRAVVEKMKGEIQLAADRMDFEKAALLRDQIRALENLSEKQSVALQPGLNADIICTYAHAERMAFYVALVRDGKLIGGESHVVSISVELLEEEGFSSKGTTFSQFLGQFYSTREVPDFVCFPEAKKEFSDADRPAMENFLKEMKKQRSGGGAGSVVLRVTEELPDLSGAKGETLKALKVSYANLLKSCHENAKNRLLEKAQIDEKSQAMLSGLQKFLHLEKLPAWIECYDISTFQGSQTVASGVVFRDGKPSRRDYRKYIIKEVIQQDDFASLREVTRRRFKEEFRGDIPDVFLVDGGEPQVREVAYVLKSLGLDHVPLFGIAKSRTEKSFQSTTVRATQERIVIPAREAGLLRPDLTPQTQFLEQGSPEYRLVTQARDEAHRVAITFHRERRGKAGKKSILQTIKGLGPKARRKIIEEYGSAIALKQVTVEDIVIRTGIKPAVVLALKRALEENAR
jgi:excinuclease ABC subunit C